MKTQIHRVVRTNFGWDPWEFCVGMTISFYLVEFFCVRRSVSWSWGLISRGVKPVIPGTSSTGTDVSESVGEGTDSKEFPFES